MPRSSPDSDSRRYRYFDPKGKRATHYEDVTVDVQPDPERYLIQNWIISFPDGRGAYEKDATAARSSNWHLFRAPDQEWERTHYQRQSKIETMVQSVIANARKSGAPKTFDKAWLKILQTHLGAWKHAEFGLGTALMQAQRYGYTQMINNATLTNSSYKLRLAQDITLYLAEIGMDLEGWNDELGKKAWLEDGIWQGTREAVETHHGLERLSRAVLRHQHRVRAAGRRAVPLRLSDAGGRRQRRLHHPAGDLGRRGRLRAQPREHDRPRLPAGQRRAACRSTIASCSRAGSHKHGALARKAAAGLQPIWSQPHSKPVSFEDVRARSEERLGKILGELGLTH